MRVALYLRVSTEEQRERQSIGTQREHGQRYCELHQLDVFEIYADDGVSGTVPLESRPAGKRVLEAAKQGRFDQLLVYKLDRLGRHALLILNSVAELERYGVRVRSMTEEHDTETANGRLMQNAAVWVCRTRTRSDPGRSVAGTNRRAESGAWLGGVVPYGYRKGRDQWARPSGDQRGRLTNGSVRSRIVRTIYRMSALEKQSCRKIADHLTLRGIPCGSGL
jgi:site-specific DNA recombinase